MHAPLVSLLALALAAPPPDTSATVYAPSDPAAVIRGQAPIYNAAPVVYSAPVETVQMVEPYPAAPYGGYDSGIMMESPTYGAMPGAPVYGPAPAFGGPPVFADESCDRGGFYIGYETVYVKPYFTSDTAFTRVSGPMGSTRTEDVDFDWEHEHSPRVWFGLAGPGGFGVQARYWQFDHEVTETESDPAGPPVFLSSPGMLLMTGAGDTLAAQRGLELHSVDLEGTWRSNLAAGSITTTGGLRYVRLDQDYTATRVDTAGAFVDQFQSRQDFEGIGPTVSLLGRRRIGLTDFALFAQGRASLLFGDRSTEQFLAGTALPIAASSGDTLMPVTELQAGGEWWTRTPLFGGSRLFLRLALEGQVWWDAGTAAPRGDNPPDEGNLGFFGLAAGGGLTY